MTPKERLAAYAAGEEVDRIPTTLSAGETAPPLYGYKIRDWYFSSDIMFDVESRLAADFGADNMGVGLGLRALVEALGTRLEYPEKGVSYVVEPKFKSFAEVDGAELVDVDKDGRLPIIIESFEMKIYSDNGLVNNTGDKDIVYLSDTKETFVNRKDDISFKISSALTSAESHELGVTDSVKMSTPVNTQTGSGVLQIYDYTRELSAKPEQLYVDSYYQEYHAPRIMMTQKLRDKAGEGLVNPLLHYRHPAMGRTFFVQGISRSINEGSAEMNLKEIEQ